MAGDQSDLAPARRVALLVVGLYAAAGALWIVSSDRLLAVLLRDPDAFEITRLQTLKGWGFVAITAALLYWLILRALRQAERSNQTLDRERAEVAAIHDSLPGMAYSCLNDAEWTMRRVSEGAAELTGHPPEDFTSRRVAYESLIEREDREAVRHQVEEALRSGRPFSLVYRILTASGGRKWVWEQGRPVTSPNDGLTLCGYIADITERKRAEEALERNAERLRLLHETDQAILAASSVEEMAHRAASEIRGLIGCERAGVVSFDEGRNEALWLAVDSDRETQVGRGAKARKDDLLLPKSFLQGKPVVLEDLTTLPDPRWPLSRLRDEGVRSFASFPLIARNRLLGALHIGSTAPRAFGADTLAIAREAADSLAVAFESARLFEEVQRNAAELERRVEERTRALTDANLRLEEANRHKSRFLSSMSHELRTPLNSVLGFADLLKGEFFGPLNEKQKTYVEHIDESGRHLLALISDLLDIAKIDAGAMDVRPELFSARDLLDETLAMMRTQFTKKGLDVETRADPRVEPIRADRRKFKQILINLLSNAAKFTPDGGRIEVEIRRDKPSAVNVLVRDTGVGIEPEEQERIFHEFYQTPSAQDAVIGGTGIGLALTRRLVELHGGEIGVRSEVGKGSEFWLSLPQSAAPPIAAGEEAQRPEAPARRGPGRRILVAEDNETNLAMILDMLSIWDHTVFVARNGQEAVDLAMAHRPDLILMDVLMPVMDGMEATRRLRAMEEFRDLPILALTASVGEEAVQKCLEAGCSAHLPKPVQSTQLFEAIERHALPGS